MKSTTLAALMAALSFAPTVQAGQFELLSRAGMESDTASGGPAGSLALSADGRWIAFTTTADDLIPATAVAVNVTVLQPTEPGA